MKVIIINARGDFSFAHCRPKDLKGRSTIARAAIYKDLEAVKKVL
jgi:hypothetical protein